MADEPLPAPPKARPTRRWIINGNCTGTCSVGPAKNPYWKDVQGWINDGVTLRNIVARYAKNHEPLRISQTALQRHIKNHLDEVVDGVLPTDDLSDIEILRRIVRRGAANMDNWRLGPSETLKAMEMYYRFTAGSLAQDLFGALSAAGASEGGNPLAPNDPAIAPEEQPAPLDD